MVQSCLQCCRPLTFADVLDWPVQRCFIFVCEIRDEKRVLLSAKYFLLLKLVKILSVCCNTFLAFPELPAFTRCRVCVKDTEKWLIRGIIWSWIFVQQDIWCGVGRRGRHKAPGQLNRDREATFWCSRPPDTPVRVGTREQGCHHEGVSLPRMPVLGLTLGWNGWPQQAHSL